MVLACDIVDLQDHRQLQLPAEIGQPDQLLRRVLFVKDAAAADDPHRIAAKLSYGFEGGLILLRIPAVGMVHAPDQEGLPGGIQQLRPGNVDAVCPFLLHRGERGHLRPFRGRSGAACQHCRDENKCKKTTHPNTSRSICFSISVYQVLWARSMVLLAKKGTICYDVC